MLYEHPSTGVCVISIPCTTHGTSGSYPIFSRAQAIAADRLSSIDIVEVSRIVASAAAFSGATARLYPACLSRSNLRERATV